MSSRSLDNHIDFAARAVEAEHKAAAATDVQQAGRWRRIAATYRHVALIRLPQSLFFSECVGDVENDGSSDPRSDRLICRNPVLIAAAAKARSDIEENQLNAARARAQAGTRRAAWQ